MVACKEVECRVIWEVCQVVCKVVVCKVACKVAWVVAWVVDLAACRVVTWVVWGVEAWECKEIWVACNQTHLPSNHPLMLLRYKTMEDSQNKMQICHRF